MQERNDKELHSGSPIKNANLGVKTDAKRPKAVNLSDTTAVEFFEGQIVSLKNVFFKVKRIKIAKGEILLKRLTPAESERVREYIAKEQRIERNKKELT